MRFFSLMTVTFTTIGLCGLSGCAEPAVPPLQNTKAEKTVKDEHDHAHAHVHLGPHEGRLVEVGDEEYHLEWVHDDATGKLTLYVIDAAAKTNVPIAAAEIEINVKIGDGVNTYKLKAVNPTGDPAKTAQFETVDKALVEGLKAAGEAAEVKSSLEITGKLYHVEFKNENHEHHE